MRGLAFLALAAAFAVPAAPALAQSTGAACALITDDAERLVCYDALFRPAAAGEVTEVVFESEQLIPALPTGRGHATMTVACEAGELAIRFAFAGNVLSPTGSNTGISLQRDLLTARATTLPPDANGTQLVMRGESDVVSFINSLIGATNLNARVTPANSRSLNVRFRIAGIEQTVAPVLAACQR